MNPDQVAEVVDKMQELQDASVEINDLFAQQAAQVGMGLGDGKTSNHSPNTKNV